MTLASLVQKVRSLRVALVEDWREALTWSETRITIVVSLLYSALLSASHALPWMAANWPDLSQVVLPIVLKFFPTAGQAAGPLLTVLINQAARMVEVKLVRKVAIDG